MTILLKSRKVHRFFERRFQSLESKLAEENRLAHSQVGRQNVDWADVPGLSDLERCYSFHDQTCPDVTQMTGETWWRSHFFGCYPLHLESHRRLSYEWNRSGEVVHFSASAAHDTWIYLISREALPTVYAIEFDYTPHSVFKEQLQLDFAATSLADRHRYILSMNERLRYQRIERGFWLPDVETRPWSLPLDVPTHVRLEVVGDVFTLLAGTLVIASWRDTRYRPHPSRNMLLFWNGGLSQTMDFELSNFRVQFQRRK